MKKLFIKYKNWIIIIVILLIALFGFLGCSEDDLSCDAQKSELYDSYSKRIRDLRADGNWEQADLLIEELSIAMENFVCK